MCAIKAKWGFFSVIVIVVNVRGVIPNACVKNIWLLTTRISYFIAILSTPFFIGSGCDVIHGNDFVIIVTQKLTIT